MTVQPHGFDDPGRNRSSIERAPGVIGEPSGERVVVLHHDGTRISTLSPVGAFIWQCLPATRAMLVEAMSTRYEGVPTERLQLDLDVFLEELRAQRLVVDGDARD